MNVLNALIGFGGFLLAVILMCLIVYWNADRLERWAKKRFGHQHHS